MVAGPSPSDDGAAVTAPPVIETARLRLRPHRVEDLDARCAMTADLETMRFIGGAVQGPEENFTRILRYAGQWALFGYGGLAVEERESGRFVGEVGLGRFGRCLGPDFDVHPEGMWVLGREAAGKGYATEGMRAVIDWYARVHGPDRMVCLINPENAPSLAVAAKLGFTVFAERDYHDRPSLLLERVAAH